VTSIARLDGNSENTRLAQVLDVEQILRDVFPEQHKDVVESDVLPVTSIPPGLWCWQPTTRRWLA